MLLPMFHVGYKNYILGNSIIMLLNPNSKPARRIIYDTKENEKYIDLTKGKAGNCLILLTNEEVAMSSISVKTIKNRYLTYVEDINNKKGEIILEPFLELGFDNYVSTHNVVDVLNFNSFPIKRIIKNAKSSNSLIDCTQGRKTRSVIKLFNGMIVLSSKDPKTIQSSINKYINDFYKIENPNEDDLDEIEEIEIVEENIDNIEDLKELGV